jgi:hypothetical protein
MLLELFVRKTRTWASWFFDGAIVLVVLLVCRFLLPEVPLRVLSLIAASLLLGLLLILVIVLIRFWLSIATIRTRYLRALPVERFESDELLLPEPLLKDIAEFERLGFRMVTRTIDKFGSVVAHLLRPSDSVVAESLVKPDTDGSALDLTSVLESGRGQLVTRTTGLTLQLWDAEFIQAFPGATAEHLVVNHEDGLAFLKEQGINADLIEAEGFLTIRTEMETRASVAARAVPSKMFRQDAARVLRNEHASVGRLRDRPEVRERIERFMSGQ